jgi:GxxExxY protein
MSSAEIQDLLSYSVIGCAMEVHTENGPGLDEYVYHENLSARMTAKDITHVSRLKGTLMHRGLVADYFEADLIVAQELVVELKVLWSGFAPDHLSQLLSYLKFWRIGTGLLLDFGKESLKVKRAGWREIEPEFVGIEDWMKRMPDALGTDTDLALFLQQRLQAILDEYGLGYRDKTYRGLIWADLKADAIGIVSEPTVSVPLPGGRMRDIQLNCLVVDQRAAVFAVALYESISAAAAARLANWLRHLGLRWGILVNFGKKRMEVQFVTANRARCTPTDRGQSHG